MQEFLYCFIKLQEKEGKDLGANDFFLARNEQTLERMYDNILNRESTIPNDPLWKSIFESLDAATADISKLDSDVGDTSTEDTVTDPSSNEDLIGELDKMFTSVLIAQDVENSISDQYQEAVQEAQLLTERNVIKFDKDTRMAQLISVCALLLQKKNNTPEYQAYEKACATRNKMKLLMQKKEYPAAKALAQQYLIKVSTTNNSSAARKAASNLLPSIS